MCVCVYIYTQAYIHTFIHTGSLNSRTLVNQGLEKKLQIVQCLETKTSDPTTNPLFKDIKQGTSGSGTVTRPIVCGFSMLQYRLCKTLRGLDLGLWLQGLKGLGVERE